MISSLLRLLFILSLAGCAIGASAAAKATPLIAGVPTGVTGVTSDELDVDHWIAALKQPDQVLLDRAAIAAQNRRLQQTDPSLHDIDGMATTLDGAQVSTWLRARSVRPAKPLYDMSGKVIAKPVIDGWMASIDVDDIAKTRPTRYALVVRRADLRTFPSAQRVFSARGDTDIDRFQESALFPGTPVVIAHESSDGKWWFVVASTYAAWVDKRAVAEGSKTQVLGYARKTPYLIVTGATVRTTTAPDLPQVSGLQLDMGVRVPLLAETPGTQIVNGQAAYASHVIELPVRNDDGSLRIVPALLPRSADVAHDYLPLTRANVLRQAFKFLGERYGWGHDYDARDCSGFVSEVYRSFGVQLPRNTGDQAASTALNRTSLEPSDGRRIRDAALKALDVGDLVFIPGHVMLVIGRDDGAPYVIHDINATAWIGSDGKLLRVPLNGVSVTPLPPLRASVKQSYVDRITTVVRVRP